MSKTQQQLELICELLKKLIFIHQFCNDYFFAKSKNEIDKFAQKAHTAKMNKIHEQANLSAVNLQIALLQAQIEQEGV